MLEEGYNVNRYAGLKAPPIGLQQLERERLASLWGDYPVSCLFHSHTDKSDGPRLRNLATEARICGFDAIFLADHNVTMRDLEAKKTAAAKLNFMTFEFGVEITLSGGPHLVVYEFEAPFAKIPPHHTRLEDVTEWAFGEGHLVQVPHPKPFLGLNRREMIHLLRLARDAGQVVLAASRSAGMPREDFSQYLPPDGSYAATLVRRIFESDTHCLEIVPLCGVHVKAECARTDGRRVSTKMILETILEGREGEAGDYVNSMADAWLEENLPPVV